MEVCSGRLVEVWATLEDGGLVRIREDVVIGTDIPDDVRAGKPANEVVYSFENPDVRSGRETLLIHIDPKTDPQTGRPTNSRFLAAFDRLDDNLQPLGANYYGQDNTRKPFGVAPRNGAIRLKFSKDLGLSQDHFNLHPGGDPSTPPIGLRNTRAVQLLEILRDPAEAGAESAFRIIPARISCQGDTLVLDPVILEEEGLDLGLPSNPEGLPESPDSKAANIRIALPLAGPAGLPGLRQESSLLIGVDAFGLPAVIRDFRAGNRSDHDASLASGFLNDPIPPQIVGAQEVSLMGLEERAGGERFLLIYQEAMRHTRKYGSIGDEGLYSPVEIKPLDRINLIVLGKLAASAVVVDQPEQILFMDPQNPDQHQLDRYGNPKVHYRVKTDLGQAAFELFNQHLQRDPSTSEHLPAGVTLTTCFQAQVLKTNPERTGVFLPKDDPRYFVTFAPPAPDPLYPTDNISPFAAAIIRFTRPIDLRTVRAYDNLVLSIDQDPARVLDAQAGTAGLIVSHILAEDGGRRVLRTQPPLGFYHDIKGTGGHPKGPWDPAEYRRSSGAMGPPDPTDRFFLHFISGKNGPKDFAGNPVDLHGPTQPSFQVEFTIQADAPTNRVANIARRFLTDDEDPNPGVKDLFGAYVILPGGFLMGRPTTRVSSHMDDLNPAPEPQQLEYRFCEVVNGMKVGGHTFDQPIQEPLSPMGCRLQAVWREIELSLSRLDPFDFNLDVEQIWWAPFQSLPVAYDIFDRMSLYLHHSRKRPSPCLGPWSGAPPTFPLSGLETDFQDNYLGGSDPVPAFESQVLAIHAAQAVLEPHRIHRFMPFPRFKKPYLVFRDERDLRLGGGSTEQVLSPYLSRGGSYGSLPSFNGMTPNKLPTIALPLLADFFTTPDDPRLLGPTAGTNAWQVSQAVSRGRGPFFRVFSAGGYAPPGVPAPPAHMGGAPCLVDPFVQTKAEGGYTELGQQTLPGDDKIYWVRLDFAKRISMATSGFFRIHSPNLALNNPTPLADPRLADFPPSARPLQFDLVFEPPLADLPAGTRIIPEFRGAYSDGTGQRTGYTLDPLAAAEAHVFTEPHWYFQDCSDYHEDPHALLDPLRLKSPDGSAMDPSRVRFFNWRLVFQNNVDVDPALTPMIDSLGIAYRFDH